MKTGLKLAALVLAVILAPRMATADAFLLQRVGPVPPSEPAAPSFSSPAAPGGVTAGEPVADCQDSEGDLVGMPKRRWGVPRRWKLVNRTVAGGQREVIPTSRLTADATPDETQGAGACDAEARGQPRDARPL
jgi:hypothetical protein